MESEPLIKKKRPPVVIQSFPPIPINPRYEHQEYRIRVVRYKEDPLTLDLREYMKGPAYKSYTRRGLVFNLEQVKHLYSLLPAIIQALKQEIKPNENQSD